MEIGEEIVIGRMGQQSMRITDASVDPQHAVLRRTGEDLYQIEDRGSAKGIFVFGMRIKRKTVKAETPILLGAFKTTVQRLLQDESSINLEAIWKAYDAEKRKWDRRSMLVNYLRVLPSILTMLLTMFVGKGLNDNVRMSVTIGLTVVVLIASMIASDKIMARKNMRIAELNADLQNRYVCPRCNKFLGFTPYRILKQHGYCTNPVCNCPLP